MRICFLGAGALGSSLGGVLSEAGLDVSLVDPWREHVESLIRSGLRLREGSEERVVRVRAATDCREVGPVDLLILLVKSYNTRVAIEQAGALLANHTVVLSLQNGLGNEETLEDVVGKARLIGGRTFAGGVLLGPGHIMVGRKGKKTYIGELDGSLTDRVQEISRIFTQAGLETLVSPNVVGMMWDKLLINSATGALAGITRLPYGKLYEIPEVRNAGLAAVAEGIAVAQACGCGYRSRILTRYGGKPPKGSRRISSPPCSRTSRRVFAPRSISSVAQLSNSGRGIGFPPRSMKRS
jgi:2-dehydropantoate 2-reductase